MLFFLTIPFQQVKAFQKQTLTTDTGEIDLLAGIKFKIKLDLEVSNTLRNLNYEPGETFEGGIKMERGTIEVSVYVPSPVNQWYTGSKSLIWLQQLTNIEVPVIDGITATIRLVPKTTITSNSQLSINPKELTFETIDPYNLEETYIVTIDSSAQHETTQNVEYDFDVEIRGGVNINLLLFSYEIFSMPIADIQMSPILKTTFTLRPWYESFFLQNGLSFVVGIIVLIFVIFLLIVYNASKRRNNPKIKNTIQKQTFIDTTNKEKTKKYCIFCGTILPLKAVFCKKCGKNQE